MKQQTFSIIEGSIHPKKTILILAWPILLEQILMSLANLVDTAMVGSLGKIATAAVAINTTPNLLVNNVVMSFGIGFSSLAAQSIGAKNLERARNLLRQAILTILCLGIPISVIYFLIAGKIPEWMGAKPDVLPYAIAYNRIVAFSLLFREITMVLTSIYRGWGNTRIPMMINAAANLFNVIGNFFLIYPTRVITLLGRKITMPGAGLGVRGAAAATTLSFFLSGIAILTVTLVRKSEMKISLRDRFRFNKDDMDAVFKISFPAMFENFTMNSAFLIVTRIIADIGTAAVAAQELSVSIESLSFMPGFAFSASATTLAGQSMGAGRADLARDYINNIIHIGVFVMLFISIAMFRFSFAAIRILTPDEEVIATAGVLLRIMAVIQIPQVIWMSYSGALKGIGDSKSAFYITLICMYGIRIFGAFAAVKCLHLGVRSVYFIMAIDQVVRSILFHLRYRQDVLKIS